MEVLSSRHVGGVLILEAAVQLMVLIPFPVPQFKPQYSVVVLVSTPDPF
jgi:hypothetical protein